MVTFDNDPRKKNAILTHLDSLYKNVQYRQGKYIHQEAPGGKKYFCAVSCVTGSSYHPLYEAQTGIPRALVYIQEAIFETLPHTRAPELPIRFIEAIPVGKDLTSVSSELWVWIATNTQWGFLDTLKKSKKTKAAKLLGEYVAMHEDNTRIIELPEFTKLHEGDSTTALILRAFRFSLGQPYSYCGAIMDVIEASGETKELRHTTSARLANKLLELVAAV